MLMLGWDFEVDAWSRFWRWNLIKICVQLVIWTQPSSPLCLWQCLKIISHLKIFVPVSNINNRRQIYYSFETCSFSNVLHQQKLKILNFTQLGKEKSKNCNIICSKFRIFTSLSQCLNILANITLALWVVLVTNCWSARAKSTSRSSRKPWYSK